MKSACQQNAQWQKAGLPEIVIAVNLCAHNFRARDFISYVESTLETTQLAPKYLDIEITEGIVVSNTEEMLDILHKLKKIGIDISIDDFGTGYSSLSYLKQLPLNTLKIDRSFIIDITSNSDSANIAKSIIALAHNMKMKVVAEGVETKAQLDFLRKCQCDSMQGFYFSKPVPSKEFHTLLQQDKHLVFDEMLNKDKRTLLILDDDVNLTSSVRRLLRRENYNLLVANTAQEAFDLLASNEVAVVVSDQRMPDMNGTEFLSCVRNIYPQTVRIILSGYTDLKTIMDAVNAGYVFKFITKPWEDDQIRRIIRESFEYFELTTAS